MVCVFCIAAVAVATATIVPALLDDMEKQLRSASVDLRRVADTTAATLWEGTFEFTASDRKKRKAPCRITVYAGSKRARIQVNTHALSPDDNRLLEERVAGLIGARIVSRHAADVSEVVGPLGQRDLVRALGVREPEVR